MNTMKNVKKLGISILLMHLLVACAKPPVVSTKEDGKDASTEATTLSTASGTEDRPLTNASGVTIYPGTGAGTGAGSGAGMGGVSGSSFGSGAGSGSGAASASSESGANDPLSDPNSLLAKRSVYYSTDTDTISDQYKQIVQAHAEYLAEHPSMTVRLEGNADERGSSEYNLALGQRRADGVKKMMLMGGVKEGQIESVSYGEEKPKGRTHDETSWSENRRTDLNYQSK
jgi:peptidoglycan-associated lipoprotein